MFVRVVRTFVTFPPLESVDIWLLGVQNGSTSALLHYVTLLPEVFNECAGRCEQSILMGNDGNWSIDVALCTMRVGPDSFPLVVAIESLLFTIKRGGT